MWERIPPQPTAMVNANEDRPDLKGLARYNVLAAPRHGLPCFRAPAAANVPEPLCS